MGSSGLQFVIPGEDGSVVSSSESDLAKGQQVVNELILGEEQEGSTWLGLEEISLAGFNDVTGSYAIGDHITKVGGGEGVQGLSTFPLCPNIPDGIPDNTMARSMATEVFNSTHPDLVKIYNLVKKSGVPNYRGLQIPVKHHLNIEAWRKVEHRLSDPILVNMLAYGFPVGYASEAVPMPRTPNHSSALRNPAAVNGFLEKEVRLGAMLGPFEAPPFEGWARANPLMTRPKRESSELRVILDLSFPQGSSVNTGIPGGILDNHQFKLRLPTLADLAHKIVKYGRGCLLYKVDLSRAYRQLRSCPRDWPFLMVEWEGKPYVDVAISFGLRHGASACQRTTEAVIEAAQEKEDVDACPYIDDTAGAAIPVEAVGHYVALTDTMSELGLDAAPAKCTPPTTCLTWIGVTYDSVAMTMSIDIERVREALESCHKLFSATRVTLHQMQKMLGKLFHASKCTPTARVFMSRLLDVLSMLCSRQVMVLPVSAKRDLAWFMCFLSGFNGITMIKTVTAQHLVGVDACLKGMGAIWEGKAFYSVTLPEYCGQLGLSINAWECYNLLVALRSWVEEWAGQTVLLYCDNWSTVCAINSGRAEDTLMREALREMWLLAANFDVELTVRHRAGVELVIPDMLSRAMLSEAAGERLTQFESHAKEKRHYVPQGALGPPLPL